MSASSQARITSLSKVPRAATILSLFASNAASACLDLLVGQRVVGLALGYEGINDHDQSVSELPQRNRRRFPGCYCHW
jgi:hypothetical protein